MSRNQPNQLPPPPQIATEQRTSFGKVLMLGILVVVAVMLVLQATGVPIAQRTESSGSWVSRESETYQNHTYESRKHRVAEVPSAATERTLQEIANEFQGEVFSDLSTTNEQKGWGLSNEEAKFYEHLHQRYSHDAKTGQNWLNTIRHARAIYQTIHDIFEGNESVKSMLDDAKRANSIFIEIQETFGIPISESRQFAPRARNLSDWAAFAEANRRQ
jgi:hypothetical protein